MALEKNMDKEKFGMKKLGFILVLSILITPLQVYAFDPTFHCGTMVRMLGDPQDEKDPTVREAMLDFQKSQFYNIAKTNKDMACAGSVLPDITVFYYYVKGGARYEATHNWAFQQCLWDEAKDDRHRAISVGVAFGHLLLDYQSHNHFIPERIPTFPPVPNAIKHPIEEGALASLLLRDNPSYFKMTSTSLKPILNDPEALRIAQTCINKQKETFIVATEVQNLDEALASPDGFFTKAFKLPEVYRDLAFGSIPIGLAFLALFLIMLFVPRPFGELAYAGVVFVSFFLLNFIAAAAMLVIGIIWAILRFRWPDSRIMSGFVGFLLLLFAAFFLVGGISTFASNEELQKQTHEVVLLIAKYSQARYYDARVMLDPTGFSSLRKADDSIMPFYMFVIGGFILILGVIFFLSYRNKIKIFRRR